MADDEKAKAEKLAAAKKRVEQLKKQKAKKSSAKKEKPAETKAEQPDAAEASQEATTDTTNDVAKADDTAVDDAQDMTLDAAVAADASEQSTKGRERQPSISLQSKMRSSSFRQASGPLSPTAGLKSPTVLEEGDTAPDIYRKQAARIEELEKTNQRLAKEAADGEKRWRKAEEELEDLRDADGEGKAKSGGASSSEIEKLKNEIAVLQRQNTQLQSQASKTGRHGASPSSANELELALASKTSTIESMEIEISNLRGQLERTASGSSAEKEQITALQEKLSRSETALSQSQRELTDVKKNLERISEKAVKDGAERSSLEPKLRMAEKGAAESKAIIDELNKKIEGLEKKVSTLTTLHKENDARSQTQKKALEQASKESADLRSRLSALDNENQRLKDERDRLKKLHAQGSDDIGLEELENEERLHLEKRVRELEAEVTDLRRGIWSERRRQLDEGPTSPGARFTDVDLGGKASSPTRARTGGGGFGDFFTNGLNAIAGTAVPEDEKDGLLEDDEEMDFDENAFRAAQEEEAKARLERIKELKRGLKEWTGWRLDIAELRRGGGQGIGEVFEI